MTPFARGEVLLQSGSLTVVANAALPEERRLMVLETADGRVMTVMTPAMADKLGFYQLDGLSAADLRQKLQEAGVALHGADEIFYFSAEDKNTLMQEASENCIRPLSIQDEAIFNQFQGAATEQDLDDAYVELDHWEVVGAVVDDRLVCAASMYPWDSYPGDQARIADLGVLTLPPFRGQGYARKVVRAICRRASEKGYEPQYRCQFDNQASASLAKAVGLTWFGRWEVISPDSAA
ncbi:GNAT family N-acetyltransferase [Hahella aquimaris]|uniref:GNAT family N-acetyltransferase n=1 Tax=Hahella sp. HNIBRBA332 TaxID=3015983 RepID=UPI00273A9E2F|nr:GNAT family N-acetyltransferase [Hahella sp. HNIBRBA332]WLQ16382.1 GNAT family N-acetyltransferase [Hahella sp. HNIBRBA332]